MYHKNPTFMQNPWTLLPLGIHIKGFRLMLNADQIVPMNKQSRFWLPPIAGYVAWNYTSLHLTKELFASWLTGGKQGLWWTFQMQKNAYTSQMQALWSLFSSCAFLQSVMIMRVCAVYWIAYISNSKPLFCIQTRNSKQNKTAQGNITHHIT